MSTMVRLEDALRRPEKYGNLTEKKILYIPDWKIITFKKEETGWDNDQVFDSDQSIDWYPFLRKTGEVCLVSSTTEHELALSGKVGYQNGIRLMNEYAKIFGSRKKKITAIPVTEEIFKELPEHLQKKFSFFWYANAWHDERNYMCGLKTAVFGEEENFMLSAKKGIENYDVLPICIVARLPHDIEIDAEDIKKKKEIELVLPSKN